MDPLCVANSPLGAIRGYIDIAHNPPSRKSVAMWKIKSDEMLCSVEYFRNNIFTPESVDSAEEAFRSLVRDGIFDDLHDTSNREMEELIDRILSLEDFRSIQEFLRDQNPNMLAFLFARFQHALHVLEVHKGEMLPIQCPPRTMMRWALVDFWNVSRRASEPWEE
jgi:hypothetical protein